MDIPKHQNSNDEKRAAMQLIAGDFYYENGFMVFTEQYLKRRGYCCKSNCRHCPYGYTKAK